MDEDRIVDDDIATVEGRENVQAGRAVATEAFGFSCGSAHEIIPPMNAMLDKLRRAVQSPSKIDVEPALGSEAIEALSSAPAPADGTVRWHLPPSYRSFLAEAGRFSLRWFSAALDRHQSIVLFGADGIAEASEIVYVPNDVDLGSGAVTTNHLVPFAGEPGGEWAFCFDASTPGPEYPVYYNHQDQPRAKLVAGGWDPSSDAAPEWESFAAWVEWLVRALGAGADPELIGRPSPKPVLRLGQDRAAT